MSKDGCAILPPSFSRGQAKGCPLRSLGGAEEGDWECLGSVKVDEEGTCTSKKRSEAVSKTGNEGGNGESWLKTWLVDEKNGTKAGTDELCGGIPWTSVRP